MDEQCVLDGPACNCCQCINDLYLIKEDLNIGDRWYWYQYVKRMHSTYFGVIDSANSYGYLAAGDSPLQQNNL